MSLISFLLEKNEIKYHKIEDRIKDKGSLQKKLESKIEKYNTIEDITDITGIRIITYFEDDVDKVSDCLKEEFAIDTVNSVDKRWQSSPNEFGYASLHQVLSISDSRKDLPEYEDLKELKFEVQIRSILQHAWAEIEHDIGYKNPISIPKHLTRSFSRIAGLLELADLEFKRIRDEIGDYTESVKNQILVEEYNLPINEVTLRQFMLESTTISELNLDILHHINPEANLINKDSELHIIVNLLSLAKVDTIQKLDNILQEKKKVVLNFTKLWFDKRGKNDFLKGVSSIPLGTGILYLSLLILAEFDDFELLKKGVSYLALPNEENDLTRRFNEIYKLTVEDK